MMQAQETPLLILVCGPNGAGKSSYTEMAGVSLEHPVVDADKIAAEMGLSPVAAGREAYRRIQEFLTNKQSFARESTLTAKFDLELMAEAKRQGYHVHFVYIGLDSPSKSLERVGSRFSFGGHNVPEADLLRRYDRSLENLSQALNLADTAIVLNNSDKGYKPVAVFEKGALIKEYSTPTWFKQIREQYRPAVSTITEEVEHGAEWLETTWNPETTKERAESFAGDLNRADSPLFNTNNQLPSYNPLTKTVFSGVNRAVLGMRGYDDPRWVTFEQAHKNNWFVKPNEQGTPLEVWSFKHKVPEQNPETGQPVLDANGQQVFKEITASQAQRKINYVFHVSQLETADGHEVEPFLRPENSFSAGDVRVRLDLIIKNSGITVVEPDSENRANTYDEKTNTIMMASRDRFNSDAEYNSNLLYMLSKAAVHQHGVNTNLTAAGIESGNPELENELRTRLVAWMAGQDLGMGYTADRVGNSTSEKLVSSWNKHLPNGWTEMLEQSPATLNRAARDAEKIRQTMLLGMGLNAGNDMEAGKTAFPNAGRLELWRAANPDMAIINSADGKIVCNEALYINAPFTYRHEVRALGAQLVSNKKVYKIPAGVDILPLSEFLPMDKLDLSVKTLSPEQTFAKKLTDKAGFVFENNELPVLDDKIHRVAVQNGRAGMQDGVYQATLLDENDRFHPQGWYINHHTEQNGKWQYSLQFLNEETIKKMEHDLPLNSAEIANVAGDIASLKWENAKPAANDHEYLQEHVFANNPDIFGTAFKVDDKVNLMQAGYKLNPDGKSVTLKLATVHYITPDGDMFFEPGCDNNGAMAILGDLNKLGDRPIYIADTVLNAASLYALQQKDSVVMACFSRENLHGVIEDIRNAYPDNKLIMVANAPGEIPKPLMPEQFTPEDIREVNASFDITAIATSYTARDRYTLTANNFNDLREAAAKIISIHTGETDIDKLNQRAVNNLGLSINDKYMGTKNQQYMDGLRSMQEKEELMQFADWFKPTHECYAWAEQSKLEALGINIESEFIDNGNLAFPCRMFYRDANDDTKIGKSTYGTIDHDGRQQFAEQCRPGCGYQIIDPCNKLRSNTAVERILITDTIVDAYCVAFSSSHGFDENVQPTLCCVTVDNVAFTVGNIKEFFPDSEIVLCASLSKDPDILNVENACELAEKYNCKVAFPALTEQEKTSGLKTFNEVRLARGNANAVETSLKQAATPADIKKQVPEKTKDVGIER